MRKYITKSEWFVFRLAIAGTSTAVRDSALFSLIYQHGLRVSELIHLRVNDINLTDKTLYVRRLKNGYSTTHPIHDDSIQLIQEWLPLRKKLDVGCDEPRLFLSLKGSPLSRQWIYRLALKYGERAGIPLPVHPHMLRHACGYELANQGLDTRLIQDYLGHRNIHHTVRYTASNPARFNKIVF